jgi:hypothetical protein
MDSGESPIEGPQLILRVLPLAFSYAGCRWAIAPFNAPLAIILSSDASTLAERVRRLARPVESSSGADLVFFI